MARGSVDPIVRYAVLGGLGWAGWNWASAQPAGSWARSMIDQARGRFKRPTIPAGTPAHQATAPAPPSGVTETGRGYEWHPDGKCWLKVSYSDGTASYQESDASNCPLTNVFVGPDGTPVPTPTPIPAGQSMQATSLADVGGFPLVFDPNQVALRQDPGQGGTNVYGAGDVVLDQAGTQYLIVAGRGGPFLQGPDGSLTTADAFFV